MGGKSAAPVPVWRRLWARSPAHEKPDEPLVSVIIPVFNVAGYVAECLDSVLTQTHRNLQVVVIDDGSTDSSATIAQRYAKADKRVELHRQANAGLGATRNRAAAMARGEYLFFLDSDDRLPADALARMVAAAREHNADVVMGPLARFTTSRRWVPRWARELHPRAEFIAGLAERPELLRSHYAAAKLYRRDFWEAQEARFREGVVYEDQPLLTRLLIAANGIVSLPDPVYDYRDREDGTAIHQQVHTRADLDARAQAWDAAIAMLADVGASGPIRCAWLHTVLGTHLHYYLDCAGIEDAAYWATLRGCLLRLDAAAPATCPQRLTPGHHWAVELLRADDHDGYLHWWRAGAFAPDRQRYAIADGRLVWQPHLDGGEALSFPADWDQLPVRTGLANARWDAGTLVLQGHHYPTGLDLAGVAVTHEVQLDGPGGIVVQPADTDAAPPAPPSTTVDGVDSAPGAFIARVPAEAFARAAGALPASVRLRLRTSVAGHPLVDPLPEGTRWFSARRLRPELADGLALVPRADADGMAIEVSRPPCWLVAANEEPDGLDLALGGTAAVVALGGRELPVTGGAVRVPQSLLVDLVRRGETLPLLAGEPGRLVPLASALAGGPLAGPAQLATDPDGHAALRVHEQYLRLDALDFGDDHLTVSVSPFLAAGRALESVALRSRTAEVAGVRDGRRWLLSLADQPAGGYDLVGYVRAGSRRDRVRVSAGEDYLASVASRHGVDGTTWRTLVSASGFVHLDTPLR